MSYWQNAFAYWFFIWRFKLLRERHFSDQCFVPKQSFIISLAWTSIKHFFFFSSAKTIDYLSISTRKNHTKAINICHRFNEISFTFFEFQVKFESFVTKYLLVLRKFFLRTSENHQELLDACLLFFSSVTLFPFILSNEWKVWIYHLISNSSYDVNCYFFIRFDLRICYRESCCTAPHKNIKHLKFVDVVLNFLLTHPNRTDGKKQIIN